MATRFQLQQFDSYYRMYDSNFEQSEPGEIARFDVNKGEAERIKDGEPFYVWQGEIIFEQIPAPVISGIED